MDAVLIDYYLPLVCSQIDPGRSDYTWKTNDAIEQKNNNLSSMWSTGSLRPDQLSHSSSSMNPKTCEVDAVSFKASLALSFSSSIRLQSSILAYLALKCGLKWSELDVGITQMLTMCSNRDWISLINSSSLMAATLPVTPITKFKWRDRPIKSILCNAGKHTINRKFKKINKHTWKTFHCLLISLTWSFASLLFA